ncbi:MAG TPA: hypothetical protein GXZ23_01220 [Clostridiales bacterium]|nr:hypothetical protein [Clostridiales bacterium]
MASQKTIENLLLQITDIINDGPKVAFSSNVKVDPESVNQVIEEIRATLPMELAQAKAICTDRKRILDTAAEEKESIITAAKTEANRLVSVDVITVAAREEAERIREESNAAIAKQEQEAASLIETRLENCRKQCDDMKRQVYELIMNNLAESGQIVSTTINDLNAANASLNGRREELRKLIERLKITEA